MSIPEHIAFIMDGNGRWASERKLSRSKGHRQGVESLMTTLDACFERDIRVVSVYAFSTENWSRPQREVTAIFDILRDYLKTNSRKLKENDTKLTCMGEISRLPADLQRTLADVMRETADCKSRVFNMGLNYGGRDELARAFNRMIADGTEIATPDTIARYLDTAELPDPDLIVRTAGEQRLSNFMLYQAAYSEFYFSDVYWPEFGAADLDAALDWYAHRKRKFGNVSAGEG